MAPRDRIWTRRQVEAQIAAGRKLIILDGQIIKADAWLPFHPGGEKSILHMVGRDGTDEIRALHSAQAQRQMLKFAVGRIRQVRVTAAPALLPCRPRPSSTPPLLANACETTPAHEQQPTRFTNNASDDLSNYPSLDPAAQGKIITAYRELDVQLRAAGLYDCPYWSYGIECLRYAALFVSSMFFLRLGQYFVSGCLLGLFWHQLVFTAHDAGHMGITHSFHIDTCIGIFIADFLGGLSIGWWKRNHNVHHIVTNSPEHDPDIEHMPFFAITSRFFESLRSTYYDRVMTFDAVAKVVVKYQHLLYYPILALGRFNLYRLSWEYLLSDQPPSKGPAWWHRWLEICGQCVFWYWYGYILLYRSIPTASARLVFILTSHIITGPLHVQITLSHFAMSTADLGPNESFPQRMLRTTMDVNCPPWMDFIHGGLQFQAIHHLFPRIPRHNLRKAKPYVERFCENVGVPYVCFDFVSGNREVLGRLEEVARQVEVFEAAQKAAVQDLIHGHSH
ncbi:hypothetical protein DV735_g2781, partial [Chaetothyriales sp. CBS 134920]